MTETCEVVAALKQYVVQEILEGDDEGIDEQSPLLTWGVLNSLEIVRLRVFIQKQFDVVIRDEDVNPTSFENLGRIASLVRSIQSQHVAQDS